MKPLNFKESNLSLSPPRNWPDKANPCRRLDVYKDDFQTISCWKMSWVERLSSLIFGRVWVQVACGKSNPFPIALTAQRMIFKEQP